ncbi:hypothetical protein [Terrimonas alba]|uniref:hypothetical protein n=1 Tax=Terrimonas alba TaxID=3349636 RepID=UPI0035F49BFF
MKVLKGKLFCANITEESFLRAILPVNSFSAIHYVALPAGMGFFYYLFTLTIAVAVWDIGAVGPIFLYKGSLKGVFVSGVPNQYYLFFLK